MDYTENASSNLERGVSALAELLEGETGKYTGSDNTQENLRRGRGVASQRT